MIDESTIERAVELLLEAAPVGSRVILFGSYARGDAHGRSDVDFLVVEPEVQDRQAEMVRLAEVLRPLRLPVDVLVTSQERFEYWRQTPNTVIHRAAREGRVYGQVA
ncbi:MAG: nucleotidyltransferase domain-containing protein [Phycisphaeraceae bacterium]|nr:nucleotidyltransferase domain-containing protein [Phycisphaeraceae bacterium]